MVNTSENENINDTIERWNCLNNNWIVNFPVFFIDFKVVSQMFYNFVI